MKRRIREYLQTVSDGFWRMVDGLTVWATNSKLADYPPIFIIGPARSGTTLAYQCMVAGLNVSYITNAMNRIPVAPVLGWKLSRFYSLHRYEFKSKFGKTPGIASPAQGIPVWTRWFPRGERRILAEEERSSLYNYVALVQGVSQMPFLNKWQGHNEHIHQISDIFPHACYIYMTRNTVDTIHSLRKAWGELVGDPCIPFSRPTPSYYLIEGGNIMDNSCAYVVAAKHDLKEWSKRIEKDRIMNIEYGDLCRNPRLMIAKVAEWYERVSGIYVYDRVGVGRVPESFESSRYMHDLSDMNGRVNNMVEKLEEHGRSNG